MLAQLAARLSAAALAKLVAGLWQGSRLLEAHLALKLLAGAEQQHLARFGVALPQLMDGAPPQTAPFAAM